VDPITIVSVEFALFMIVEILATFLTALVYQRIKRRSAKFLPCTYEWGLFIFFLINVVIWTWDILFNFALVPLEVGFENFLFTEEVIFQSITLASLIIIIYTLEKLFWTNSRHIISTLAALYLIFATAIGIPFGFTIVNLPLSNFNLPIVAFLPFFYLYLVIRGTSAIRMSSLYFFLGFGAILLGGISRYRTIEQFLGTIPASYENLFHLLSPIFLIVGSTIVLLAFLKIKNFLYIPISSIHVFDKSSGVCMFETYFDKDTKARATLITGGLYGITHLIKEITTHKTQIKEIKQEDINVLIDYGAKIGVVLLSREALRLLRSRLKYFIQTFEDDYELEIATWQGDIGEFKSCIQLIHRIFEPSLVETAED
jgi:hypothetical protein